jgi:hypothetical protein
MNINSLIELARERRRFPKNIVARGVLIDYLMFNSELKFLADDICLFLKLPKSTMYHSQKSVKPYDTCNTYLYFSELIEKNKIELFEKIKNFLEESP